MIKLFSSLFVLLFLLFQVTLFAEETTDITEPSATEEHIQEEVPNDASHEENTVEPEVAEQEDISDAQREADAAEAAELREVGEGEEPIVE